MSLKRLKNGCWRYRFLANGTKAGKYVQKTLPKGMTQSKAKEIYRNALARASAWHGSMAGMVTFGQLAAAYLHEPPEGAERCPCTRCRRAEETLRLHLLPIFGHMDVDSIRPNHIERWQRERLAAGAEPATVNRQWSVMKAILNFGEAKGYIERNPIRRGAVKPLPLPNGGMRSDYFRPEEWRSFLCAFHNKERWEAHLEHVRGNAVLRFTKSGHALGIGSRRVDSEASAAYRARLVECIPVFKALLYTSARLNELLSLTWEAIDFERNTVTIFQHKVRNKKNPKKTLPMCAPLRALLKSAAPGVGEALVFRRADGSPFYDREVQRAFALALKLSEGNPALSVHSIRHTVGSWLTIAGHPERKIGEILGHSCQSTTSRYAHLGDRSLRPILDDLVRIEAQGFRADEESTDGAVEVAPPAPISSPVTRG